MFIINIVFEIYLLKLNLQAWVNKIINIIVKIIMEW